MADASFQEVVFHGIFHQVIVNGGFCNAFVVLDGFVVISFERGKICDFEIMLVRQPVKIIKYPRSVILFCPMD